MSFPYSVGQVPVYYNHFNTGRPKGKDIDDYVSKYLDIPNEPLLPFGFGLSYTTFVYDELELSAPEITHEKPLTISVKVTNTGTLTGTVTNTGTLTGTEVVQLYIRDLVADVVRPVKELKDYQKINLKPSETKAVVFRLTAEQLRYYHSDLTYTSDVGKFQVFVGTNSTNVLESTFKFTEA